MRDDRGIQSGNEDEFKKDRNEKGKSAQRLYNLIANIT